MIREILWLMKKTQTPGKRSRVVIGRGLHALGTVMVGLPHLLVVFSTAVSRRSSLDISRPYRGLAIVLSKVRCKLLYITVVSAARARVLHATSVLQVQHARRVMMTISCALLLPR